MKQINFSNIEKKWQKAWSSKKVFVAKEKGKKYYCLEQYPYPSGSGLHMGHTFIYTIGDIHARLKRMQGFDVLHPIGFDSFGLPAENAAIKAKSHPKKFTEDAIENFKEQMNLFGFSYDWDREVKSHDLEFYKWDQWIFLKLLEKGLAYRKKSPVNWCPKCNTVLANEQVQNGKCWRHEDTNVEIKDLEQWFFRITEYAEELYDSLDSELKEWPEVIKSMQRNWIGKSKGLEIKFDVEAKKKEVKVFTTRPDTLFGVTFLVVSAQHKEVMDFVSEKQRKKVESFLLEENLKAITEEEIQTKERKGIFSGSYAKHPITGKEIPIWISNYVLADYGSGVVMAVPSHDERDFDFAKKNGLEIIQVIESKKGEFYSGKGKLINSGKFNGLESDEAFEEIAKKLISEKKAKKQVNFRLRDWLISRQRFWGCPIPIIYCDKCGAVPVPEKDLPVKLPEKIKFSSVENPLAKAKDFFEVKCPKCKGNAKRETDTMDTFVDSSWYFLRYLDPKNKNKIFDSKKANHWMPIDMYIGGKEHAVLHDIYFRFFTKFLRDLGLVKINEPAKRLFNQGFVFGADGRKMSKSYGNTVVPEEAAKKYSVDAVRMFLVSVASPDKDFLWSEQGVEGSLRFLLRAYDYIWNFKKEEKLTALQESKINRLIRDYSDDLENFRYNLAVIKLREIFSIIEEGSDKKNIGVFLKLLSPICPHFAEELWERLGFKGFVCQEDWPKHDSKKINEKLEEKEKNLDKTIKDIKYVIDLVKKEKPKVFLYVIPNELDDYESNRNKILELSGADSLGIYAVNDKNKYDPQGKSSKAKPGKPGIYVE